MASLLRPNGRVRNKTSVVNYVQQKELNIGHDWRRDLVRGRLAQAKSLYRRDLLGHYGCVNAIEFSQGTAEWIVSGGDDRRVLVWNVQQALAGRDQPKVMKGQHNSNIFCLSFDQANKKIFSGGNDEQVVVHDFQTGATLDVFPHDDVVYGLSVDPNNENVFASAADDGKVRIYDIREQAKSDDQVFCLAACLSSMHAVMYNPAEPRFLLTANNDEGVGLWDIRKPKKCLLKYGGDLGRKQQHDCMSVRLNHLGTQLIALYRRRPLMLYNIDSPTPVCKFSSSHTEYLNCCTMKSCCFAGDKDQYVLSGSDLFHVFMWEVPDMDKPTQGASVYHVHSPHMLLKGHRSIVNQVRYSDVNHLLVSSGVEKVVKIWSPFPLPGGDGDLSSENSSTRPERVRFTQEQSMSIVLRHDMMHDYSNGSVEEDPHMMAFFDSLIQAGGDPWSSDEDSGSDFFLHQITAALSDDSDRSSPSPFSDQEAFVDRLGGPRFRPRLMWEDRAHHHSSSSSSSSSGMSWGDAACPQTRPPRAGQVTHLDTTGSDSDTLSAHRDTPQHPEVDTPYRARAKKAVKRLRLMRARVANSDTSDSEPEPLTDAYMACAREESLTSDKATTSVDSKSCDTSATHELDSEDQNTSQSENHSAICGINGLNNSGKSDGCGTDTGGGSGSKMLLNNTGSATQSSDDANTDLNKCLSFKTTSNGKVHVPDNVLNGQASSTVQNPEGDNTVFSLSRETTLCGEVNGNRMTVASTSSASCAEVNLSKDPSLTENVCPTVKTSFKKLKNRNVSHARRHYRRHSSSSGQNQSSGEEG